VQVEATWRIFQQMIAAYRQPHREGQEDQLGALGLILNAIVLWNTRYLVVAVTQPTRGGHPPSDTDRKRL